MIDILRVVLPGAAFIFLGFALLSAARQDADRPAVARTRRRYAIIVMLLGVAMIALHIVDR